MHDRGEVKGKRREGREREMGNERRGRDERAVRGGKREERGERIV